MHRSPGTAQYGVCGHSDGRRRRRPPRMPKHRRKRRPTKRSLALPDLEQTKSAVLNSLSSKSGQRTYDHAINEFVDWYCSEPRLAFNRTVVLQCTVCPVLPPGLSTISDDADIRNKTQKHLERCIQTVAELGASVIAGPLYAPVGYLPGHRRTQE